MKNINTKLWSHLTINANGSTKEVRNHCSEIRRSEPLFVPSFTELVKHVANISYNNRNFNLFFRGQHQDYREPSGDSSIYPSIYRDLDGTNKGDSILENRFQDLDKAVELLLTKNSIIDETTLRRYKEMAWAILQHYEVCLTPLLDVTHSLRVACSFALNDNRGQFGYIYVLGLPYLNGSISYFVEEDMFNIKLLSICPPTALRPYFQDGYLIGDFPVVYEKTKKLNFARRLVAKFKIPRIGFWSENFTEIPYGALYPDEDQLQDLCLNIKRHIKYDGVKHYIRIS